jgi:hypothetical protein
MRMRLRRGQHQLQGEADRTYPAKRGYGILRKQRRLVESNKRRRAIAGASELSVTADESSTAHLKVQNVTEAQMSGREAWQRRLPTQEARDDRQVCFSRRAVLDASVLDVPLLQEHLAWVKRLRLALDGLQVVYSHDGPFGRLAALQDRYRFLCVDDGVLRSRRVLHLFDVMSRHSSGEQAAGSATRRFAPRGRLGAEPLVSAPSADRHWLMDRA